MLRVQLNNLPNLSLPLLTLKSGKCVVASCLMMTSTNKDGGVHVKHSTLAQAFKSFFSPKVIVRTNMYGII